MSHKSGRSHDRGSTPIRKKHHEGSIHMLPSGRFRWRISVLINGESHRLNGTAATEKQARADMRKKAAEGVVPPPAHLLVSDCVDTWLKNKEDIVNKTRNNYIALNRLHVSPRLGARRLRTLTPAVIRDFLTELRVEKGLSANSRRQVYTILYGALGQAVHDGLLPHNPAAGLRPSVKKKSSDQLPAYNHNEAKQYLAATMDGHNRPAEVLALLLLTGLRKGEALYLRWDAVSLEGPDPHLFVRGTRSQDGGQVYEEESAKTRKSRRRVPLDREAVALLAAVRTRTVEDLRGLGVMPPPYVFSTLRGTPYRPDNLQRVHLAVCQRAGIRRLMIHSLRHTYASLAAASGMKIEVLSRVLGHESPAFTMAQYRHLYPDEIQAVSLNLLASQAPEEAEEAING
jgi:integrase